MAGRKKLKLGIPEKEDSGDLFAEKGEAAPKKGKSASKNKQSRDEAREDKKAAATELEAPSDSVKDISAFLRNVRRRQKVDLRDVAAKLNIRLIHLQAIEEGRFADLPGPTYVIGFVRAYAEFLKLDQQAVVAKFRSQMEGLDEKIDLKFPVPEPETRVPTGAIILVSILLAAVAYGSWYRFSTEGRENVEVVSEVPDRLFGLLWDEAPPSQEPLLDQEKDFVAEDARDERFATDKDVSEDASGGSREMAMEETPSPVAASQEVFSGAAMTEQTGIVYFDEYGREYVAKYGDSPLAPAFADHVGVDVMPGEESDQEAGEAEFDGDGSSVLQESEDDEEAALPSSQEPAVFGQQYGDVRIVIHVTEDSWIQVRDATGALLVSQLLHPGDSYRVPIEGGLTLMTGNAGALQFLVDGSLAPSIGPPGSVRRDVALDPDSLLAGTAVSQ
ncbi:MAG: helix-turn-helix domain-containing protein [Alphaproteobacteria bacterium]|nr:helix-turn-helix domain-containing protein [Alphaproteobacteria bacterium]